MGPVCSVAAMERDNHSWAGRTCLTPSWQHTWSGSQGAAWVSGQGPGLLLLSGRPRKCGSAALWVAGQASGVPGQPTRQGVTQRAGEGSASCARTNHFASFHFSTERMCVVPACCRYAALYARRRRQIFCMHWYVRTRYLARLVTVCRKSRNARNMHVACAGEWPGTDGEYLPVSVGPSVCLYV